MSAAEGAAAGPLEVVRARRFELVDVDGVVRALLGDLGPRPGEVFGLVLLDPHGRARLRIELGPTGPALVLDQDGNDVIELAVHDVVADALRPGSHLRLSDRHGRPALAWHVEADGSATLRTGAREP
jgi:hypothetical protein